MEPHYDIFISHKSEDKPWVEVLADNLERCGWRVFLDSRELVPGERWIDGLAQGLDRSRAAVLVATPETIHSGWVRDEYARLYARLQRDSGFRFVPIVFGSIPDLPFLDNRQAVDFRDPGRYREAFQRLLCGLRGEAPGSRTAPGCEVVAPAPRPDTAEPPQESTFLDQVADTPHQPRALILVAQADRGQAALVEALRRRLARAYGPERLLHITPPYSPDADPSAYFTHLGRQCGFQETTGDSLAFAAALERRLPDQGVLLVLVTGFEHGCKAGRRELAGELRALLERRPDRLRVVLCGGGRLAALKFADGEHSLLNQAEYLRWPDLGVADVLTWQAREFPALDLSPEQARDILTVTGGLVSLVRYCLQHWHGHAGDCRDILYDCPFLWQSLAPFAEDPESASRVCRWLEQERVGRWMPWPTDPLLRTLYWSNLVGRRGRDLVWSCESVREVGRLVLACEG